MEVGKEEQLGEDRCPEKLRIWLKKTRENALMYEVEARKMYREQILLFQHVMATTPLYNSFKSFSYTSMKLLHKRWNSVKNAFIVQHDTFTTLRNHNDQLLRPSLGSVNNAIILENLNAKEMARSKKVNYLVQSTRQRLLQVCLKSHF